MTILVRNFMLCIVLSVAHSLFAQTPRVFQKELPVIADGVPRPDVHGRAAVPVTTDVFPFTTWTDMGVGSINGPVFAYYHEYQTEYMGGAFDSVGGLAMSGIAQRVWPDTTWSAMSTGIVGTAVYVIAVDPSDVGNTTCYAGGNFSRAGGVAAHNIAYWNGSTWSALGAGVDSTVLSLVAVDSILYVGGNFLHAGGIPARHLAAWNLHTKRWSAIIDGDSNGVNGGVAAISAAASGALVVGGGFSFAGTQAASKVATLINGRWSPLGDGIAGTNAYVSAITGVAPHMFQWTPTGYVVCGEFSTAGGIPVSNVALWDDDSSRWYALGSDGIPGVNGPAYGVAGPSKDFLFLTGSFTEAGSTPVHNLAWFDGTRWASVDGGIDGIGYGIRMINMMVVTSAWPYVDAAYYVWGGFTHGDTVTSPGVVQWMLHGSVAVHESPQPAAAMLCAGYPNPVTTGRGDASIVYSVATTSHVQLAILDVLGRRIATLVDGVSDPGRHTARWLPGTIPAGTYTVALRTDHGYATQRLVIMK